MANVKSFSDFQLFLMRILLRKRREDGRLHKEYLRKEEKDLLDSIKKEMDFREMGDNMDPIQARFEDCFYKLEPWVEAPKVNHKEKYHHYIIKLSVALNRYNISHDELTRHNAEPYVLLLYPNEIKSPPALLNAIGLYHVFQYRDYKDTMGIFEFKPTFRERYPWK